MRALTRAFLARTRRHAREVRLVLVYHGVQGSGEHPGLFPPKLSVATFRHHLDHLRKSYAVIPLARLADRAHALEDPSRPHLALTFDDDLSEHLTAVAPLLREHELPATFFLTGSSLDDEFNEWWLDLEALASKGSEAWGSALTQLSHEWPWAAGASPSELATTIVRLPRAERERVADVLRRLSGGAGGDPGLGAGAVRELAAQGFEVGFHTRRHQPLDTLEPGELVAAMNEGLDELAAAAGTRPVSIAYPHGKADLRVAHAAAEAGFQWGFVMGQDRAVRAEDRPLLLPRIDPYSGSLSPDAFAFRLARIAYAAARAG
jgi:peptidoglycan/xylan/chitin deacetylase (PgdA/CDA1 family)